MRVPRLRSTGRIIVIVFASPCPFLPFWCENVIGDRHDPLNTPASAICELDLPAGACQLPYPLAVFACVKLNFLGTPFNIHQKRGGLRLRN